MPGHVGLAAGSKVLDVKGPQFYILVSVCLAQYLKLKCNRAGVESVPCKTANMESLGWGVVCHTVLFHLFSALEFQNFKHHLKNTTENHPGI